MPNSDWAVAAVLASIVNHSLGVAEDAAEEVYVLRANVQAIFCRRRHQPRRRPPAKIRPGSAGDGRAPRAPVRAEGTPSDPNHPWNAARLIGRRPLIAALHLVDRRDETILY
jgi:hypothetical protein